MGEQFITEKKIIAKQKRILHKLYKYVLRFFPETLISI